MNDTRLDEYDKDEWRVIAQRLRPDLSDAEFDAMWADFCAEKAERERQQALH
jgi:hypothetical protein